MITSRRPASLAATAALLLCLVPLRYGLGALASTPASKQLALDSIAKRVLLPAYADLAARSVQLAAAIDALTAAPTAASLTRAQEAWGATLVAWRRTQVFSHGPVADLNVMGRIQFWPSRRQSVERVLRAERPITSDYIQELGANAVGLSALEVLLFDAKGNHTALVAPFTGPQGDRQRQYARAVARDLVTSTAAVVKAWQGGYGATFAAGGQDSVNLLINDLLSGIETGAQNRLRIVVDQQRDGALRPDLIEGSLSGSSRQGLLALLTGARAAFAGGDGPGLDDYLAHIRAPTARRIETQFQKAIDAVQAIDGPLERTVTTKPEVVARALDECHALEIMLKTEVVSGLGVTITVPSTDGD